MLNDFTASSFEAFKKNFLIEKALDDSSGFKMGDLSKQLSKVNIDSAKKLNRWASQISNKVEKYLNRLAKKGVEGSIYIAPAEDLKDSPVSIIKLKIKNYTIKTMIYDSNQIVVFLPKKVAELIKSDTQRKILNSKDQTAKFLIATLERVAN